MHIIKNYCNKCKNTGIVVSVITTTRQYCDCHTGVTYCELVKPKPPELIGEK